MEVPKRAPFSVQASPRAQESKGRASPGPSLLPLVSGSSTSPTRRTGYRAVVLNSSLAASNNRSARFTAASASVADTDAGEY